MFNSFEQGWREEGVKAGRGGSEKAEFVKKKPAAIELYTAMKIFKISILKNVL